jgi:HSP20 family protein
MASSFWTNNLSEKLEQIKSSEDKKVMRVAIKNQSKKTDDIHELALDIYETEEKVYILAPIAGVNNEDIEIEVDENTLIIRGTRKNPFYEENESLYLSECYWGDFERKITLPSSVDTRDMNAYFKNGILYIEAFRIAPSGKRRILVR